MSASASERSHPVMFCAIAGGFYGGIGGAAFIVVPFIYSAIMTRAWPDLVECLIYLIVAFPLGVIGGFLGGLIVGLIADIYGSLTGGAIGGMLPGAIIFIPSSRFGLITGAVGAVLGLCIGYLVFYKPVSWLPMLTSLHEVLTTRRDRSQERIQRRIGWSIVAAVCLAFIVLCSHHAH